MQPPIRLDPTVTNPAADSLRKLAAELEDDPAQFDRAAIAKAALELGVPEGPNITKRLAKVIRAFAGEVQNMGEAKGYRLNE